ncbi:MAG: hypothetical protein ACOYB3_00555 [Azonexus sp.]
MKRVRKGRYVVARKVAKNPMRFRVYSRKIYEKKGCVGLCWPGSGTGMEVDPRLSPKDYLDTVVHEALHLLFPKAKETKILRAGTSVANLLWRLGYRRAKSGAGNRT